MLSLLDKKTIIGVWQASLEQISFLDSVGLIYQKIEGENQLSDYSFVFLFGKTSYKQSKKEQTIFDFCAKRSKKFIRSVMLSDEQIDLFEFVGNLSNITSVPMDIYKQTLVLRKGFYIEQKKLPAEEVPLRDVGGLQRLFVSLLKEIFFAQGLPLTLKSFSPEPDKIPFLFRNDTDFCDKKTIEDYYANINCRESIKTSWFVHCKKFENTQIFSAGENDEFALHCFLHKVKPINENLQKGIEILQKSGKKPLGYSAPYGVRNEKTDVFLQEEHKFEYSSDFSFASDAFAFFVENTGLWQIPVFPLCIGSFIGVCDDDEKIIAVFERYFARQARYKAPFVIYDHPDHKEFGLLNKIFKAAQKYPILPMTFLEYSRFLEKRRSASLKSDFPTITFYPESNKKTAKKTYMLSRFSLRLIKNTIINCVRRRNHDTKSYIINER